MVWVLVALVLGAAGGWAVATLLRPPPDPLTSPGYTLVAAQDGEVGREIGLNTTATWRDSVSVVTEADGVVTQVLIASGDTVTSGDPVASVGLRPVVVAEGEFPSFRTLEEGVEGPDVAQLHAMLTATGFGDLDGEEFTADTAAAVEDWQRDVGFPVTGVVESADLAFVPGLPRRGVVPTEVTVGGRVSPGTVLVNLLPDEPDFQLTLQSGQAQIVRPEQIVTITSQDGLEWQAQIETVAEDFNEAGDPVALLAPVDGADAICGAECETLSVLDNSILSSRVQVEPVVAGIVVPVAAVVTTADGQLAVQLEDGTLQPVTVEASAGGRAVITGLDAGVLVRTPGEAGDPEQDVPDNSDESG